MTPRTPLRRLRAIVLLAVIGAPSCGACRPGAERSPTELAGTVLASPLPRPDFTLTTARGEPYDFREETSGRLTLLFFGYTNCPDICPMHMAHIAAVLHKVTPDVAREVDVVMATVDPERDTPERLRTWLDQFDPSFVGLTGTPDQLEAAQRSLRMPPAVKQGDGPDYLVGHAAYVVAFTADDTAHVIYPAGTRQSEWARDLPLLISGHWDRP